ARARHARRRDGAGSPTARAAALARAIRAAAHAVLRVRGCAVHLRRRAASMAGARGVARAPPPLPAWCDRRLRCRRGRDGPRRPSVRAERAERAGLSDRRARRGPLRIRRAPQRIRLGWVPDLARPGAPGVRRRPALPVPPGRVRRLAYRSRAGAALERGVGALPGGAGAGEAGPRARLRASRTGLARRWWRRRLGIARATTLRRAGRQIWRYRSIYSANGSTTDATHQRPGRPRSAVRRAGRRAAARCPAHAPAGREVRAGVSADGGSSDGP